MTESVRVLGSLLEEERPYIVRVVISHDDDLLRIISGSNQAEPGEVDEHLLQWSNGVASSSIPVAPSDRALRTCNQLFR